MEYNSIPFIIEIYINNHIQDQVHVNGVDEVLKSIKPLILKFYPKYDYNDIVKPFPVKLMIIDRTMNRKPMILNYHHELYAWYLSYEPNRQQTKYNTSSNHTNNIYRRNAYEEYLMSEVKNNDFSQKAKDFFTEIGEFFLGMLFIGIILIIIGWIFDWNII